MLLMCYILCGTVNVYAAGSWNYGNYVPVNINSGNPAFPYPQFLEYRTGKTLAKYNPEGVTHADMEKTGREAYEIMSHRCRYDGGTHCGVPYITFNNFRKFGDIEMPQGGAQFCTEGDGYMLLAAAIFGDQPMFNGLWMWIHDNRIPHRVRYQDGQVRLPNYEFGGGLPICYALEGSTTENDGSATDGDDDIAMALLIAYKQWGEFMMQNGEIVKDFNGNPISYKAAAEDFLKAFVDTVPYRDGNYNGGHMSGNIGVDGYVKGGNKGSEVSTWRLTQTTYPDISPSVNIGGVGGDGNTHIDYCAPAYYNEFAKWLESDDVEANDWQIGQFKRAEASSDWLCGKLFEEGSMSSVGTTTMATDGVPNFIAFLDGEDFRTMWRFAQNYLWHGAPETIWNPKTHQVEKGTNSYELDMAKRVAAYMKEPKDGLNGELKCKKMGKSPDPGQPEWFGPAQIVQSYFKDGTEQEASGSNYALGAAAPAAVLSGDLEVISDLYRQSELVWDDASGESHDLTDDERYILSMPKYFHGWFRCMALLTHTGNWHAPSDMVSAANMKVYMSVDKTYAYQGDKIDYTVQYRNYGSAEAKGVTIETEIDPNYDVVSISDGGKFSGGKIVWNIGEVPGFKSGHLEETIDSVSFRVIARDTLNPRICLTSTISGDNFENWVSNEYPNHATYTMERNCVDILANRSLAIKKTANRDKMNPNDIVKFTVEFENKSEGEASWLNGGRDNVRLSYGNYLPNGLNDDGDWTNTTFYQYYRFWNDASEAYINMGNYRVSYFMNDINKGFYDAGSNPNGWQFYLDNENDVAKYGYFPETGGAEILFQKIPAGDDEYGAWNQRFIVKFPDVVSATTTHVYDKLDSKYLAHKGIFGPGLYRTALKTFKATNMKAKVADDWSYSTALQNTGSYDALSGQALLFTPITPGWYSYDENGKIIQQEITNYSRHSCASDLKGYDRVLVEEFDGYTWRRIQGRGPLPGREAYDVEVLDTIPIELEWKGFVTDKALGVTATYTAASGEDVGKFTGIVRWFVPEMLVGEKGKLVYEAVAKDIGCDKTPQPEDVYFENAAWISSKTDSPDSSKVDLMISCNELPPVIDPQTSLFKDADKKFADVGETVEYTVYFKNTEGTAVEGNMNDASDWVKLGNGNVPKVNGQISMDQNANQGISFPFLFANQKSYGKDVTLETTWNVKNASTIYLLFRYQSGIPYKSDFKGVCLKISPIPAGDGTIKFEVLDGSTVVATEKANVACPAKEDGTYNPMEIKISVKDDKMYIYVNDFETVLKTYKGLLTTKPGYVGVYSDGQSQQVMNRFYTEVDYAFDVTLYDQLPEELGNVTGLDSKAKWDESKNYITWPTVATTTKDALAPGDSIGYTFTAEVLSCNNYINNYGLATVYGKDTLKVLNTIGCGATECLLTSATASLDETAICEDDSTVLRVAVEDKGSYLYEYYLDGTKLCVSKYDTLVVKNAGIYSVIVRDPSNEDCFVESDKVTLKVNNRPVSSDFDLGAICINATASMIRQYGEASKYINEGISLGYAIEWYDTDGVVLEDITTVPEIDVPAGKYSYVYRFKSKEGCYSDSAQFIFAREDTAHVGPLPNVTICAGQSATLSLEQEEGLSYLWSDGSTEHEFVTSEAGDYTVIVTTQYGCLVMRSATVTVAEELVVDLGEDQTICEANTPFILDATTNYDSYEWSDGSAESTFEVTESGEYEVKVTQGTCQGSGKINIVVSPTPVLNGTFEVNYLVSDTTSAGIFDKSLTEYDEKVLEKESDITYVWYDKNEKELSEEPTPVVPSEGNAEYTYYVKAVNADGCESELQEIKVVVVSSPMPEAEDVNYCLNGDATPLEATPTDNGSNSVWTLTWYDAAGTQMTAAPTPSTAVAGKTTYYVTQTDPMGVEGAKKSVTVTVFDLPVVAPIMSFKRSCDEPILLNPLFSEQTGIENVYMRYFDPDGKDMYGMLNCVDCTSDVKASISGTYTASAYYYPVKTLVCSSAEKAPIKVTIDKIEDVKVTGSPSICPFEEIVLTASASSKGSDLSYEWSGDATSSDATVSMKDAKGIQGKVYSFDLNITAGACEYDTTVKVTVGRGQLTGALFANGEETKEFNTCGGESVKLSTTHTGTDFVWTNYDGEKIGEGTSVEVNPETTTTYIVSFINKCETSDTIEVKIFPFSVEPLFDQLNTEICEGESASAKLVLNGYDPDMKGSYIKWFKDGEHLSDLDGKVEMNIKKASLADAGVYTFEASNGICLATNLTEVTSATLAVKPFVSFAETPSVVVVRGEEATLSLDQLKPAEATLSWKGDSHEGEGNPFVVSNATSDELFKVQIEAENYCARDTQLQLLVDAKVMVSASTETAVICLGDEALIEADTTGTGKLLRPDEYKLTWYACDESGNCKALSNKGLTLKDKASSTTSYYVEVVYGEQTVESEKVPVTVVLPPVYDVTTGAVSCSGEEVEVTVNVSGDAEYEIAWENGTTGATTQVAPETTTTYSFTITQQGICPIKDQVEVKVKEKPAVTLDESATVCSGSGVTFEPEVTGDDIISYQWEDPSGAVIAKTQKLSIETAEAGKYTLTVVSESCGEASASQEVNVVPLPEVSIDSINLKTRRIVAEGAVEYRIDKESWSTEDTYENLLYDLPHTAFARDENGCVGMTVFVVMAPPIAIPEYFSPDGSGQNDTWDVSSILDSYPKSTVKIYDRYGKLVAELEGDTSEWDGTYNGHPLPSTDYWYTIHVPEIAKIFKGHFTLIRGK